MNEKEAMPFDLTVDLAPQIELDDDRDVEQLEVCGDRRPNAERFYPGIRPSTDPTLH